MRLPFYVSSFRWKYTWFVGFVLEPMALRLHLGRRTIYINRWSPQ